MCKQPFTVFHRCSVPTYLNRSERLFFGHLLYSMAEDGIFNFSTDSIKSTNLKTGLAVTDLSIQMPGDGGFTTSFGT